MDSNLPGSSVHGILQARILEWVATPSSRGSSRSRVRTRLLRLLHWLAGSLPLAPPGKLSELLKLKVKGKSFDCVGLFVTPWTVAYQGPPSMGFSRQQYWSGLPFPSQSFQRRINEEIIFSFSFQISFWYSKDTLQGIFHNNSFLLPLSPCSPCWMFPYKECPVWKVALFHIRLSQDRIS